MKPTIHTLLKIFWLWAALLAVLMAPRTGRAQAIPDALQSELTALEEQYTQLDQELDQCEQEFESISSQTGAEKELSDATLSRSKDDLKSLISRIEALLDRREGLDRQLEALAGRIKDAGTASGSATVGIFDSTGAKRASIYLHESFYAEVDQGSLPTGAQVKALVWSIERPDGQLKRPSRERAGLRWPLRAGDDSPLGRYQVSVIVTTDQGIFEGSASFELIEKKETDQIGEDGGEKGGEDGDGDDEDKKPQEMQLQASVQGPLYTGKPTRVRIANIPFKVEFPERLKFQGKGACADPSFWVLDLPGRKIEFRPKKPGAQNVQFSVEYDQYTIHCDFSCNVELTELKNTILLDDVDMDRLEIPFEVQLPDYLERPMTWRFSQARAMHLNSNNVNTAQGFMMKGYLNALELKPGGQLRIDYEDNTGAQARTEMELLVLGVNIKVPDDFVAGKDAQLEVVPWRSAESKAGGIDPKRLYTTPNILAGRKGGSYDFVLHTDPKDKGTQLLRIVGVGKRGVVSGTDDLKVEKCVCQDPPSSVKATLLHWKDPSAIMRHAQSLASREDEAGMKAFAISETRKLIEVFRWWGNLKKCKHLSNNARAYFSDMGRLLELGLKYQDCDEVPPEVEQLVHRLQHRQLGPNDIEEGFMGDLFEGSTMLEQLRQQQQQ